MVVDKKIERLGNKLGYSLPDSGDQIRLLFEKVYKWGSYFGSNSWHQNRAKNGHSCCSVYHSCFDQMKMVQLRKVLDNVGNYHCWETK